MPVSHSEANFTCSLSTMSQQEKPITTQPKSATVFNVNFAHKSLTASIANLDSISLVEYLGAYREFMKYVKSLNKLVSFASSEAKGWLLQLEKSVQDPVSGVHYHTVQAMIAFERQNGVLGEKPAKSGCRALLGLNRGLEFLSALLGNLSRMDDQQDTVYKAAKTAYKQTVAKFDSKIRAKAVKQAFRVFPNRAVLLKQFHGGVDVPMEEMAVVFKEMARLSEIAAKVYREVHRVLEQNELLDLA